MNLKQCIRRTVTLARSCSGNNPFQIQEWKGSFREATAKCPILFPSSDPSPVLSHGIARACSSFVHRLLASDSNALQFGSNQQSHHTCAHPWAHLPNRGSSHLGTLNLEPKIESKNIQFRFTREFSGRSLLSRFKTDQEKIKRREKGRAAVQAREAGLADDQQGSPDWGLGTGTGNSVVKVPGLLQTTQVDMSGIEISDATPPPTQPLVGPLRPANHAETMLANLVARPDLVIERKIEWANLIVGMEQQNRYLVTDLHKGYNVGTILETSNWISRQLLRTHRPFVATIYDATGLQLCTIRRPFYIITSEVFVEVGGEPVGHVQQRWHLWKRKYDLYRGKDQFAEVVNGGLWWWTFNLLNFEGKDVAVIDRNWRGLGLEFFTDAGQYVVRFGDLSGGREASRAPEEGEKRVEEEPSALSADRRTLESAQRVPEFEPARPLDITERAITLSLAVALDVDYFSRHTEGAGFLTFPFIFGGGSSD